MVHGIFSVCQFFPVDYSLRPRTMPPPSGGGEGVSAKSKFEPANLLKSRSWTVVKRTSPHRLMLLDHATMGCCEKSGMGGGMVRSLGFAPPRVSLSLSFLRGKKNPRKPGEIGARHCRSCRFFHAFPLSSVAYSFLTVSRHNGELPPAASPLR